MGSFLLALFFWLFLSIIVGVAARSRRGRDGVSWFLLSLLISPLLAGLLVLALPNRADRWAALAEVRENRDCPFCSERIKRSAVRCRYCGADLSAHPAPPPPPNRRPIAVGVGVLVVLVCLWALNRLTTPTSMPTTVAPIDTATVVTAEHPPSQEPTPSQQPQRSPATIPLPRPAPVKER